jgi:predicted nucleotidyltransferase
MSKIGTLVPLLSVLRDLVAWLKAKRVQGLIIGGVAASILGRPRVTRDVDALVLLDEKDWDEFLTAGTEFGFVARVTNPLDFARKAKVLLIRHEPSGIDVDVAFGALPFEKEAITNAVWVNIRGVRLPLPNAEDLIIMKAVAHRPRDLADIESIMDAHPNLNLRKIRRWVKEFSTAIEMPDILNDLEKILTRRRKRER